MLTIIVIKALSAYRFSIALARNFNSFACACVRQITLPAAAGRNFQNKAVCIDVVKPTARHAEVACKRAVLQGEQGS